MKLLIAGGREFKDFYLLNKEIKEIQTKYKIDCIISGGARGADRLGEYFAKVNNIKTQVYEADWDTLGKKAGYIRNVTMGEICDLGIVFWDGKSRGSSNMIDILKEKGKLLKIVYYNGGDR